MRLLVLLLLITLALSPKSYGQEWLEYYHQSIEYYSTNQLNEALTSCESALVKYKREASLDHNNYRVILRQLSVICYNLNHLKDGEKFASQEVESWRSATQLDESSYIDALDNLGIIYAAIGDYDKSIEVLNESYITAKNSADKTEIDQAIIEGHLAESLFGAGQFSQSAIHFKSCMKVLDEVDEIPGDYINFCYSYGTLCTEQGDYEDAIKYLTMLFQWFEETEQDPLIINTNAGLGTAYTRNRNLKQGEHHLLLAKLALESSGDASQQELLDVTKDLALNIEQQGRHEEAKELMAAISDNILNSNDASEEQAYFINSQATILLNSGKINEALEMYDQALKMLVSLQQAQSDAYSTIGLNAIKANDLAGNFVQATELAKKILAEQDPNSQTYYMLVAELGSILRKQGDYESANQQFDKIYIADRANWPNRDKAQILNKTASHYQRQGNFERSNSLYQEAMSVITPEEDKSLYQSIMFNYITLLLAQGKVANAQTLLDDLKNSIGSDNPEIYLGILRNIGSLAQSKGDFSTAEARYLEALALAKELTGEESELFADILLRLATLDKDLGNYQDAEPKFIRVSEIVAEEQGTQHPNYASVLNNMGILYQQMGNYEKAENNFLQAIAIYKKVFGENNPDYVLSLENLATLYELMGNDEKAINILATTLAANKRIYGELNPNYAISLHNYASLLQKTDRKDEAFNMLLQVLALQENSVGRIQPSYANSLHNLAILAQEQENYHMADSLLDEVLRIRSKLFNVNHPSYTSTLYSKAVLLQVTNRYEEAWIVYNQVIDQYLGQIDKYFPSLSEKEKNAFYAKVTPVINRYKEFCIEYYLNFKQSPEALTRLYDAQLATKALLLNAVNKTRRQILNSGNQQLINEFNQWTSLKKQLVTYYSYSKEQVASEGINIKILEEQANSLEKSLSQSSEHFAGEFDKIKPTWQQVASKLQADEAAIEIIRIERNGIEDSITYAALALLPNSPHPALVTMPYGTQMETKYYKFYINTVKYHVHDKRSYNVFWQPIDQLVSSAKTIYISADGVYNKININTIFNVKTDHYLIEDYFVKYISSTRDLIKTAVPKSSSTEFSILCLGDPAYDLNGPTGEAVALNDLQRSQLNMNKISPLPGTKKEIAYIDSLLIANNWQVEMYMGKEALEQQIKIEDAPKVIHLATHGFFMPDLGVSQIENQTGRNDYDRNPLFRSGLLFAGASNIQESKENDGILTAYEAMNLYLDNTELVVLSACETALGDVKNGEGVYGLQRALQVAGAQKLIMSLWKVNDEATMQLMSLFYSNWVKGEDIYHAMQNAQIVMLREHEEPYYWGAFIMIGI